MRINPFLGLALKKKPVRRRPALWSRLWVRAAAASLAVSGLIGAGWQVWDDGWIEKAWMRIQKTTIAQSVVAGLAVRDVIIEGRLQMSREEVMSAVDIEPGTSIVRINPHAIRQRLEALGWVKRASVELRLPNKVKLRIQERRPLARWQNQGKWALIDHEGEVILREGIERFEYLPHLVGAEVPAVASEIIEQISAVPGLIEILESAIHVSGRRWNLNLKGNIEVLLPEENVREALIRLGRMVEKYELLKSKLNLLDLRKHDRLIIKHAVTAVTGRKDLGLP